MGDQTRDIFEVTDNRLVTVRCKTGNALLDIRPACLMGLVNLEKKEEENYGWILLIAGDPFIPHAEGAEFKNKIAISRLNLTEQQKFEIIQSSIVRDGYVYLYGGNFSVGKCQRSEECQQHNNFNVLQILNEYMNRHILEIDYVRVVPLDEKSIQKIVMPRILKPKNIICGYQQIGEQETSSSFAGSGQGIGEELNAGGRNEKLKFRVSDHKVFVELECPADHMGYHVGILLVETFICKPNVLDSCDRSRITRIVEQADVKIPPNLVCHICQVNGQRAPDRIVVNVKGFYLPRYGNRCERKVFDEFKVKTVEYRIMAHFIEEGEWKGLTVEKLFKGELPIYEGEGDIETLPGTSRKRGGACGVGPLWGEGDLGHQPETFTGGVSGGRPLWREASGTDTTSVSVCSTPGVELSSLSVGVTSSSEVPSIASGQSGAVSFASAVASVASGAASIGLGHSSAASFASGAGRSSNVAYPSCSFPVKLLVMEIEIQWEGGEDEVQVEGFQTANLMREETNLMQARKYRSASW